MAPTHESSKRSTGANTLQHSVPETSRTPFCSVRTVTRRIWRIRNALRDSLVSALYFVNLQQQWWGSYIYSTSGPVITTLSLIYLTFRHLGLPNESHISQRCKRQPFRSLQHHQRETLLELAVLSVRQHKSRYESSSVRHVVWDVRQLSKCVLW